MRRDSDDSWEVEQVPRKIRERVGEHRLFTDDVNNSIPNSTKPPEQVSLHQKYGKKVLHHTLLGVCLRNVVD